MSDWLLIALGIALLIGSAELLVRGAVWCALAVGISPLVVGLTLVAFGTSAPELVVGVTAALDDKPDMATGSVLGSNVANIGLIIGLTALLRSIDKPPGSSRFEVTWLILTSVLLIVPLLTGEMLTRTLAGVLAALIIVFTIMLAERERRSRKKREPEEDPAPRGWWIAGLHILFVLAGFVGLKYGGETLVEGASGVARSLDMSEAMISQTIVAIGTSLPELATSLIAARRGHPEIALGNVLGSNVFNVCMVLGVTGLVVPLPFTWETEGAPALLGIGMAVALGALLKFRGGVPRLEGGLLLLAYIGFLVASIVTNT